MSTYNPCRERGSGLRCSRRWRWSRSPVAAAAAAASSSSAPRKQLSHRPPARRPASTELEQRDLGQHLVVRPQAGRQGHRHADQHRHDRHQAAGHRLQRRPEHDSGVLHLRQRQRRRQRPSAQALRPVGPDPAGADRGGRQAAHPDRSRRRDCRRVRPARMHDRPGLLEGPGHLRDGGGHRPRMLVDAEQRGGQHGAALQLRRSGAVRDSSSTPRRSCSCNPTCPVPGTSPPARRRWPRRPTCRSPS